MTHYEPQSDGTCFVEGLGWVVQCSRAVEWGDTAQAALDMLSATPSPTIDVAAVREVIAFIRSRRHGAIWEQPAADKLARAIGDPAIDATDSPG